MAEVRKALGLLSHGNAPPTSSITKSQHLSKISLFFFGIEVSRHVVLLAKVVLLVLGECWLPIYGTFELLRVEQSPAVKIW